MSSKAERNTYLAVIGGIWAGVLASVFIVRYVTIPPLPWPLSIKMCLVMGLVATPVMLFCAWLALSENERKR